MENAHLRGKAILDPEKQNTAISKSGRGIQFDLSHPPIFF